MQLASAAADGQARLVRRGPDRDLVPASFDYGAMVLDRFGIIRYCDTLALQLLGAGPPEVIGRDIRTLIPQLPLSARTPGYNLAYATFCATRGPRLCRAFDSSGRVASLEIWLDKLDDYYEILIGVRKPVARAATGDDCLHREASPV